MRHWRRLLHCLAAGAVTGAALAPLQLLLWPEVALSVPRALLAAVAWAGWGAAWLGAASFLVLELIAVFADYIGTRPGFSLGLWRWLMTVDATLVAAVAFVNREHTRELLVRSHRDALSVAGSLVTLLMLGVLVAAIRRRPSRSPRVLGGTIAAALVAVTWATFAATPDVIPARAVTQPPTFTARQRLLLVSWEGADLPWLVPAIEHGDMPFLRSRREVGAWGQVRTVRPFSRTAALTTLATGCRPAVHGVLGRRAYRLPWLSPVTVSLLLEGPWPTPHQLPWRAWQRAATPAPRRAPLWEILEGFNLRVGLAGWPGIVRASWRVPPPLAAEALPYGDLDEGLRSSLQAGLEAHPALAPATRAAFSVAVALAREVAGRQAQSPADVVIFDSDVPSRLRPLWTLEADESTHGEVLAQAARLLDEQLADLWAAVGGEDALLVVVSPFGMAPPSPWARLEHMFGGGERWRVSPKESPDGFVLLAGPGVRGGARLSGCRLADVTATTLYLLGLPVARDMSGKVLLDAVDEERTATVPLRLVPSYPPTTPHRR